MDQTLDIHPDFKALRAPGLSLSPTILALANAVLTVANALAARKLKGLVRKERIRAPDGHHIPIQLVRPTALAAGSPALVYLHGGAFILKQAPQHLLNAARYAQQAQCLVVLVDYRLAPRHPFPAGFDDGYDALRWTLANADRLGIDSARIAIGGDSAGGALAASAAQKAAHAEGLRLCGQLLLYPVTDIAGQWPSGKAFANVPPFRASDALGIWDAYLGHAPEAGLPPYSSPLKGRLSGLAPAYVETAEFDPLHDEGIAYAEALGASGTAVQLNATRRTVHGFDLMVPGSALSVAAMDRRIEFLRHCFAAR